MARSATNTRSLSRLLGSAGVPIYVLDEQRRIVYCNPACASWIGIEVERLLGKRCDYHSSGLAEDELSLAAGLCPPPEVFAGRRTHGMVSCLGPGGQLVRRRAEFLPLGQDDLESVGVVVVLEGADSMEAAPAKPRGEEPDPVELHEALRAFRHQQAAAYRIDRLVGESPVAKHLRAQAALAVQSRWPVLIIGPPGSGRQYIANTIYHASREQADARLAALDCALLDAELLQHTIMALVRSRAEQSGRQDAAVLFLEADKLPGDAQAELAGFLSVPDFPLRILATARVPLLDRLAEGAYRADLAHALSTLVIQLPPLASRREDIPLLAQLFLEEANAAGGRQLGGFTSDALDALVAYSWPGNLDELAEMVQQSHQQAEGTLVRLADLPRRIHLAADAAAYPARPEEKIVLEEFLAQIETELIGRALARAKGNKTKAAELLGMSRSKLHRRIEHLGMEKPV